MSETVATEGSFVWFDLLTRDPQAAVAFYTHVVGWTSQAFDAPGGAGYTLFVGAAGGLGGTAELPEASRKIGVPPHWTSNVFVDDVDRTVAAVREMGGSVMVAPSDFPNVGRLAVIADPQGAPINVFTPRSPMKLHDNTKPGEFNWCELMTTDHEAAFSFYSRLFGWKKVRDFDMGPGHGTYLIYGKDGQDLGGMFTSAKDGPIAPAWIYYIQVPKLDAAVERAKAKGAKLMNGPMEVPGGARIAQLADPQGAIFALHENARTS
jgi:predicted enzyme related to lactoylglutathione lyase